MSCKSGKCTGCWNVFITAGLVGVYFAFPSPYTKILAILYLVLNCGYDTYGQMIAYGLAISSLGDIALEVDRTNPMFFLAGLVFFLIAHLFYIRGFLLGCMEISLSPVLFSAAYYVAIMSKIIPDIVEKDEKMKIPVLAYGVAILLMIGTASTRAFSYHLGISNRSKLYAVIGAALFVASDSLIAIDKFSSPIENVKTYVMVTYYLGQAFIGASAWPCVSRSCPFCSAVTGCSCAPPVE